MLWRVSRLKYTSLAPELQRSSRPRGPLLPTQNFRLRHTPCHWQLESRAHPAKSKIAQVGVDTSWLMAKRLGWWGDDERTCGLRHRNARQHISAWWDPQAQRYACGISTQKAASAASAILRWSVFVFLRVFLNPLTRSVVATLRSSFRRLPQHPQQPNRTEQRAKSFWRHQSVARAKSWELPCGCYDFGGGGKKGIKFLHHPILLAFLSLFW